MKKTQRHLITLFVFSAVVAFGWCESARGKNDSIRGNNLQRNAKCNFSGIYAFGDSLTDTGNFYALTGQPPEPYFPGRVSNGMVWIEYLSQSLKLNSDDVINYAYAGATTGRDNFYDIPGVIEFPGLQDQIDFYQASLQGGQADPDALYVIWAGANDFFINGPTPEAIENGIQNIVLAVQRLHFAGAKHILVMNLPDLGATPFGQTTDPQGLSFLTDVFNGGLSSALDELSGLGVATIQFDIVAVLNRIESNPRRFGFDNVTDAYLETGGGDPNRYLYWDSVHPTTRGHAVTSKFVLRVLMRYKLRLFIEQLTSSYRGR